METKREMPIGKQTVLVTDTELKQSELLFYAENPRVFSALHTLDDDAPSQETIEKEIASKYESTSRFDHLLIRIESAYNLTIIIGNITFWFFII